MRDLSIVVVCGAGFGSSALLVINIERALKSLGVEAKVEASGLPTLEAFSPDIVCCAGIFTERIRELPGFEKVPIVEVKSFANVEEIKEKLKGPLRELGYLK